MSNLPTICAFWTAPLHTSLQALSCFCQRLSCSLLLNFSSVFPSGFIKQCFGSGMGLDMRGCSAHPQISGPHAGLLQCAYPLCMFSLDERGWTMPFSVPLSPNLIGKMLSSSANISCDQKTTAEGSISQYPALLGTITWRPTGSSPKTCQVKLGHMHIKCTVHVNHALPLNLFLQSS